MFSWRMAYWHVRDHFGRMALSVLAVALGVALVVAFRLMNAAILQSFLDAVDGMAGRAALSVTAGEGLTFSEDTVQTVAGVPGVTLAVPLVRSVAFPDDRSGELLTVHGVDLTHEAAVRLYHDTDKPEAVVDDLVTFLNEPNAIIVGREFAERRGLSRGSSIDLVTPRGVQAFTVKGLLDPQGLARTLRGRLVVMDIFAAERAFTADGQINQIDIVVAPDRDVAATRAAVAAVLPAGLTVEEPAVRKHVIRDTVAGFQAMVTAFSLLAVVAGFVICYSRLGAIFEARTWEVGLLRAVGMPQSSVFLELLKESLLLGVVGTLLGCLLGGVIATYVLPYFAAATAIAFRLPVPSAKAHFVMDAFGAGLTVGLLAAVGAAAVPALRLSRTQPVAALTLRGREIPALLPRIRWAVPVGLLMVILLLLICQLVTGLTVLGHLTSVLLGVEVCTLAAPIVRRGGHVIVRIWETGFGSIGQLAARHLGEHGRRASLTVGTLGVGLSVVLLFGTLGWSFERTLVSILLRSVQGDLIISSSLVSGAYWASPIGEQVVADIAAVPGVAVVAGEQSKEIPYADGSVFLKTFDAISFHEERIYQWPLESGAVSNALEQVEREQAVLVTRAFAHQHGTRVGEQISLGSPNGPVRMPVAAISGAPIENAIIMNRRFYRDRWNDRMVSLVHVAVDNGTPVANVEASIAQRLGVKYRLQIRSRAELISYFAGQVRQAFSVLYLMEAVVFVLVLMGIGDTLASGVVERTRELGMMRAIGLSRAGVFGMVMLEGAAIGVLGLILAAAAGIALGIFWVEVQFPAILGWKLDLHFPTTFALGAAGLTILLCLLGSLLPSLRAARLAVPEALRNE